MTATAREPTPAAGDSTPAAWDPTPAASDPTSAANEPTPAASRATPAAGDPTPTPSPSDLVAEREDGDATDQLMRAFKRTLAALRRLRGRESHSPGELSYAQYGLLFCLRERSELSLRDLAVAAELSPASATEMLDGLAAAGLVQRIRSERDRRVVLTSLTDRGRALVEEQRARVEPRLRAALSGFTDQELLTAAAVLEALRITFEQVTNERP